MTQQRIIARLWSSVYDLLMYIEGKGNKSLDQIHRDLDETEAYCRPYADADDGGQAEDTCRPPEGGRKRGA